MFMNSKDKFVYLLQNRTELSTKIYKLIESSLLASYDHVNKTHVDPPWSFIYFQFVVYIYFNRVALLIYSLV